MQGGGGGGGGEEGLVHTACACALISRHSRNSVARADISVLLSSLPYIIQRYVFRNLSVRIQTAVELHRAVATLFSVCSARLCS